jgi:hypothetical protein
VHAPREASAGVVVLDVVGDQAFELLSVSDDGAGQLFGLLEEFAANGADPLFGECVGYRGADRCLGDLEAFGAEDLVERVDELAACLGGPGSGGAGSGAGVEDLGVGDVDERQDLVAVQQGGVGGEEVAGHRGLGVQELRLCDLGWLRRRIDNAGFEDLPHGGGGDPVAEACEFSVDGAVTPGWVLGGEA